ncbi:MAG: FHA domain-containing protein [Acidobacteria bacterium]|nr:MAG: FHA domain-containing protein [Acidobacteriota bacterium]
MKSKDHPKLIALTGPTAGDVVDLEADATSVGREPGNDIVIEAQYVSRHHCRFEKTEDGFRVVDLDSHNGTSVNGVPVKQRALAPGDRISLGGASFLFTDPSEPPAAAELELEDVPLPTGATVQLRTKDAVYLKPERLSDARLKDAETRKALGATLELIGLLGSTKDDALPDKILNQFVKLVPAERSAILMGNDPENLDVMTMRPTPFAVSRTVLGKVLGERTAILSNEVAKDGEAGKSLIASKVRSLAVFPLAIEERVIGALYLDSREPGTTFPEDAMELLMGLAGVASAALEKARQLGSLRAENRRLQQEFDLDHDMVGESPKLKAVQKIIARVAPTDTTVLIEGESGTGKELAARAIHFNSDRRDRILVKVDCTGLTENLLASELFGHEKGAFTGAIQQKKGKLEIANGGTVFLDEIGELPLALQSQLLRAVQDREFERVGGTRPLSVDIRLVAATNRELAEEVKNGNFREDLYYRLNVVKLKLPPLRERPGDIELLTQYFVAEFSKKVKRPVAGLSESALSILKRHDWPGNIRELSNTIERAIVLGATELILPEDLPEMLVESKRDGGPAPTTFHEAVAQAKKKLILDAVGDASGSITEAGKFLGLHPNYLHRLISNLGLRDQIKSS